MLRFAIAGAALILAATATPVAAAPRDNDCIDCPVSTKYDSPEVVRKIRSNKNSIANEAPIDLRPGARVSETRRIAAPRNYHCTDCPPPRKYDTQEVVRKTRNIDRSQVINTRTVVPVGRRYKETNHLVIRQNEIRNTGVIQHNHTIVEKETRYVRRIPVRTTVEFITHNYRVVERPDSVSIPVAPRRMRDCSRGGRYGSCRPVLRVRG